MKQKAEHKAVTYVRLNNMIISNNSRTYFGNIFIDNR